MEFSYLKKGSTMAVDIISQIQVLQSIEILPILGVCYVEKRQLVTIDICAIRRQVGRSHVVNDKAGHCHLKVSDNRRVIGESAAGGRVRRECQGDVKSESRTGKPCGEPIKIPKPS